MTIRLFRWLLRLYPAEFRDRFEEEMLEVAEHHKRRPWLLARDFVSSLVRAHLDARCAPQPESGRARAPELVSSTYRDVTLSLRNLKRTPGFTAVAVTTVALGIGANVAIFSVVNGVVLRPLPYPEPARLIAIEPAFNGVRNPRLSGAMSQPDVRDIEAEARSVAALAGYAPGAFTVTGMGEPEVIQGARVTKGLLDVFRTPPVLGRDLRAEENVPGGPRVVVIGHRLWQARFGGNPDVIGQPILISSIPYEIVGVAPAGFDFPAGAELWRPRYLNLEDCGRGCHTYLAVGRLAAGVSLEDARRELSLVASRLEEEHGETNSGKSFVPALLGDRVVGRDVRTALFVLLGAVGVVLSIACTNVAQLLLTRASRRTEEMALRRALGASRRRILRQLLAEAFVLAIAGGTFGILLAHVGLASLLKLAPANFPRLDEVTLDGTVLTYTAVATVLATVVFGLTPAASLGARSLVPALGRHRETDGRRRSSSRALLLALEVALSVVLLFAAGQLLRSFVELRSEDLGFAPDRVTTFSLLLPNTKYPDGHAEVRFFRELESRLRGLPTVESAGSIFGSPMGRGRVSGDIDFLDRPAPPPGREMAAVVRAVTPGYFETLRIPLLRGRWFEEHETRETPRVALVNESFAARFYPGRSPLGEKIHLHVSFSWPEDEPRTIVGVVGDIRARRVSEPPVPEVFVPHAQFGGDYRTVLVRARADAGNLLPAIRAEVRALDAELPLRLVETLEAAVARSIDPTRFYLWLLALFAALAVVLAMVGLSGVVAFLVSRRTREIGIRMALGARAAEVVRMVASQGLRPALSGLGLGLGLAFLVAGSLESMLYDVPPADAWTLAAVSVLVLAVAALAVLLPALRASRISPSTTLRSE